MGLLHNYVSTSNSALDNGVARYLLTKGLAAGN